MNGSSLESIQFYYAYCGEKSLASHHIERRERSLQVPDMVRKGGRGRGARVKEDDDNESEASEEDDDDESEEYESEEDGNDHLIFFSVIRAKNFLLFYSQISMILPVRMRMLGASYRRGWIWTLRLESEPF